MCLTTTKLFSGVKAFNISQDALASSSKKSSGPDTLRMGGEKVEKCKIINERGKRKDCWRTTCVCVRICVYLSVCMYLSVCVCMCVSEQN